MRPVHFTAQRGGINRLRDKGGASADTLFDLVNAYVTPAGKIRKRPGLTKVATLEPGTVGLFGWQGKLRTFSGAPVGHAHSLFLNTPLRHPASTAPTLTQVHFTGIFLGRLYVVGEFSDGKIAHFWLQNPPAWQANTAYTFGRRVQPSTPNGFVYEQAATSDANAWRPNRVYAINDVVQPTSYNGFTYKLVARTHDQAASSATEPAWPTTEGARIKDRRPVTGSATAPVTDPNQTDAPPPPPSLPPVIEPPPRYGPWDRDPGIGIEYMIP